MNQYNNIESSQTQDAPDYTSYQQRYGNPSASSQKVKSVVEESKNSLNKCLNGMIQSLRVIIHLVTHY